MQVIFVFRRRLTFASIFIMDHGTTTLHVHSLVVRQYLLNGFMRYLIERRWWQEQIKTIHFLSTCNFWVFGWVSWMSRRKTSDCVLCRHFVRFCSMHKKWVFKNISVHFSMYDTIGIIYLSDWLTSFTGDTTHKSRLFKYFRRQQI